MGADAGVSSKRASAAKKKKALIDPARAVATKKGPVKLMFNLSATGGKRGFSSRRWPRSPPTRHDGRHVLPDVGR